MGSRTWVVMLIYAWSGRHHLLHPPCLPLPLAACVRALPLAETKIAPTEPLKCQDGAGRAGPRCCCECSGTSALCCGTEVWPLLKCHQSKAWGSSDKICCRALTPACQASPASHLGQSGESTAAGEESWPFSLCVVGSFICHTASCTA